MNKKQIILDIDYLRCPISSSDIEDGTLFTGINAIDNNDKIQNLNFKIGDIFSGYYKFDSDNQACWFDEEDFENGKESLLLMLSELIDELNKANDGSYEIIDKATEHIKGL